MHKSSLLTMTASAFPAPLRGLLRLSARGALPRRIASAWADRPWATADASKILFDGSVLAPINGELFLQPLHGAGFYREFEPKTRSVLASRLKTGMTFLDVGANIGYFTVLGARQVGETGKVYAVEPSPNTVKTLKRNLDWRCLHNVTVLPVGAGAKPCLLTLRLTPEAANDSFVELPPYAEQIGTAEVRVERLDSLITDPVDFVKLDVQGVEIEALEGMSGIIANSPTIGFLIEWHGHGLIKAGHDPMALPDWLEAHGFRDIKAIDDFTNEVISLDEAKRRTEKNSTTWYCNIIAERG